MILVPLLIVPILFWLIPFARLQQQDRNEMRRFILNFSAMLLCLLVLGLVFWQLEMDFTTLCIVLLSISAAWGVIFHLISRRFGDKG